MVTPDEPVLTLLMLTFYFEVADLALNILADIVIACLSQYDTNSIYHMEAPMPGISCCALSRGKLSKLEDDEQ